MLVSNDIYSLANIDSVLDYFKDHSEIQVDTETEGHDPHTCNLVCLQIGDYHNQFVIEYDKDFISALKPLLEDDTKIKVLHNAKFDLKFFRKQNIIFHNIFDTFLAECVINTGYNFKDVSEPYYVGTSLAAVADKYCNVFLDKSVRGEINRVGLTSKVITYAAEDVKYLSNIKEAQIKQLISLDLLNTMELENKAVVAFAALEFNGIKVDPVKWNEVAKETTKLMLEHESSLDDIIIKNPHVFKTILVKYKNLQLNAFFKTRETTINWGSAVQKLKILKCVVPEIESTGERELQRYKNKHEIFKKLLEFNKFKKLTDSFGEDFLKHVNKVTGRVHCDIWQIISTGRISVSEPNLNQIPAKGDFGALIRSCFIAEKGNVIVGGDYSSMELRIIAEISEDPLWLKVYKENKDLHSVLCASTFNIDEADVKQKTPFKPDISYRDVQKTINFGLAYGMSEFKLADTMGIEIPKAKTIINNFFSKVPYVKAMLDMFAEIASTYGKSRTLKPFRRIRFFPELEQAKEEQNFAVVSSIERAGKNAPIQGTNGDIIKVALWLIQRKIDRDNLPIKLLLSVYDEIRTECPIELSEWWKDYMEKVMKAAARVCLKKVPIVVDCKITEVWEK